MKLAIAQVLTPIDTKLALQVFQQAVAGLNQQSGRAAKNSFFGVTITVGPPKDRVDYSSAYDISGKDFSVSAGIADAVTGLAGRELEATEAVALTLADPDQLAEAISPLVVSWLKKLPAVKTPRTSAIPRPPEL